MSEKARRRPTIGTDPLDSLIPGATATLPRPVMAPDSGEPDRRALRPPVPRKVRATFHLPESLLEEARNTVVALSGPPVRLTLADLAEAALRHELTRLKDAHNKGQDFPERDMDLRGGRPIGS